MDPNAMQIRILHLDDNEDDRIIAKHHFTRLNDSIDIVWAETADEARQFIQDGKVDCIISDYQMPRENGLSFLRSIREEENDIPFILLTGHGNEEIATRALKMGADDYFSKISGASAYERVLNSAMNLVQAYNSRLDTARAEARFRQLFTESVSGTFEILDNGTIVAANDSFYSLIGFEDVDTRNNLRFSGLFEKPAAWQKFLGSIRLHGRFEKQLVKFVDRNLHSLDVLIQAKQSVDGSTILGTVKEDRRKTVEDSNGDSHQFSIDHFLSNTAVPVFYFVLHHPIGCDASHEEKMQAVHEALLAECNQSFLKMVFSEATTELIGNNFNAVFANKRFQMLTNLIVEFAKSDEIWRQAELEPGSKQYYNLYSVRRDNECIGFWGTIVL